MLVRALRSPTARDVFDGGERPGLRRSRDRRAASSCSSSSTLPAITASGRGISAHRRASRPTSLPCRLWLSRHPSPEITQRLAAKRAGASTAVSTRSAPELRAASNAAQRPPARPPAAPVRGRPRGSLGSSWARPSRRRSSCATDRASAPFWGANTVAARSKGSSVSQSTSSRAPRRPPPSRITSIAPRPPSVLALPPAATSTVRAPASSAASTSSPVPRVDAASASRSCSETRPSPEAAATSTTAVLPSASSANAASIVLPSGSEAAAPTSSPPSAASSTSAVPSPPSASGHRSLRTPTRSSPLAIAVATAAAENVPLKESGARSTAPLCVADTWWARRASAPSCRPG